MQLVELSFTDILISATFIAISGIVSTVMKLGLHKDLLVGSLRLIFQLSILGTVLGFIFTVENKIIIVAVFIWMIFWAAHTVRGRVKSYQIPLAVPIFASMAISYILVLLCANTLILNLDNAFKPQYFIPMAGMLAGNGMNGIALALERMLSSLRDRREEVECLIALGASPQEASGDIYRDALKAGLIPSINMMCATGLVSIPGMMTGQILAGSSPVQAANYQILIIFMIVGATSMTCILATALVRRKCFDDYGRLTLTEKR